MQEVSEMKIYKINILRLNDVTLKTYKINILRLGEVILKDTKTTY